MASFAASTSSSAACSSRGSQQQGFRLRASARGRALHATCRQHGVVLATMVGPEKALNSKHLPKKAAHAVPMLHGQSRLRGKAFDPLAQGGKEIEERAMRLQMETHMKYPNGRPELAANLDTDQLEEAYERCRAVTADYAKTFYLGTTLMAPEKAKAIWAIYVWCRRTDELVDGPNSSRITPEALDRWEERLEALFDGRPYDILDAALTDTISKFPLHIQPFRDMIDGMRLDLFKLRYQTFDELYGYCYMVAGTVALMSTPVMGIDPSYKGDLEPVYRAALALGTANQLTNILRDVGEDINERNRIYVPMEDIKAFNIEEREVLQGLFHRSTGQIDDRWVNFMQFQINRAREYFDESERGVNHLDANARYPVWSAAVIYAKILDKIENNGYDNFSRRAYVPKLEKFASLPRAYGYAALGSKLYELREKGVNI